MLFALEYNICHSSGKKYISSFNWSVESEILPYLRLCWNCFNSPFWSKSPSLEEQKMSGPCFCLKFKCVGQQWILCYIQNVVCILPILNRIPNELRKGKKPIILYLHQFGLYYCDCYPSCRLLSGFLRRFVPQLLEMIVYNDFLYTVLVLHVFYRNISFVPFDCRMLHYFLLL